MKWIRRAFCAVIGLLAGFVVLYLWLVHPNDGRIAWDTGPQQHSEDRFSLVGSLLYNGWHHEIDVPRETYLAARSNWQAAQANAVRTDSARFRSPYQVYVPVGQYPARLDARDAFYLPPGSTMVVKPALDKDLEAGELRTAFYAGESHGELVIDLDGARLGRLTQSGWTPLPLTDVWHRAVGRYLDVDPVDRVAQWEELEIPISMHRGSTLRFSCASESYGCVLADVQLYASSAASAQPKNILFILVDTMRADALQSEHAPHMRRLAAESVVFDRALAPGNMTSPSTNALLSCRLPSQMGRVAFAYTVPEDQREAYYRRKRPSFPAWFTERGFNTAMVGSVSVISEAFGVGIDHGFRRQIAIETDGYDTAQIGRETVRWLARNGNRPFFLYVHFNAPHAPYRAPFADIRATFPGFGALTSYPQVLRWLYQGEIRYTDRYIGKVLSALDSMGLAENTIVVLTADHGDHHTQRRFSDNAAGPNFTGSYFDHGATLLNDEIQVPLAIKIPGVGPRHVEDFVSTLDVGPTLLDLMGLDRPSFCAGESLRPYVQSGALAPASRVLAIEGFQERAIVFENRYKYVRSYEPIDKRVYRDDAWGGTRRLYQTPEQLYDLSADPAETTNLARQEALRSVLIRARTLYERHYSISHAYEIVVDSPTAELVEVFFAGRPAVSLVEGRGELIRHPGGIRFIGRDSSRVMLKVMGRLAVLPQVRIGRKNVALRQSSLRLPLATPLQELPLEQGGLGSVLELSKDPSAFIRVVLDDGRDARRIVTGNPAFEKILREWGYLNDQ